MCVCVCVCVCVCGCESNSAGIIRYLSSKDKHNEGKFPVYPATVGQTIILVELE